jgi:cytochrome b6-f complex iron-sulfur subunit
VLIPIAVVVILGLAAVALLATARRRTATGSLSRETRRADASAPSPGASPVPVEESADEDARARADEARQATEGGLVKASSTGVVRYEPVDEEELGITRRQFFNRGILTGIGISAAGFGAASLAFLWPSASGGLGGKVTVGTLDQINEKLDAKEPYYNAAARTYIVRYPEDDLKKAATVYPPSILAGMEQGYVALYQKCPHLGCKVPWCQTSQWFECPCHGSKYNRVGEKRGGPAPRGMDRWPLQVSGNSITVDTSGTAQQGPPIGTDTTGQGQEGAACV